MILRFRIATAMAWDRGLERLRIALTQQWIDTIARA